MGFVGDLINRPEAAIETIREKRKKWKWIVLVVITGFLMMLNFFFFHFTGGMPHFLIFGLILSIVGIILEFVFILGYGVNLYILLRVTKHKPAGDTTKIVMWCAIVPSFIFHLGLFLVGNLLIALSISEVVGYLYDTLKFAVYIWIIALSAVAVAQTNPKHKLRNIILVLVAFAVVWGLWTYLVADFFGMLFTSFI